MYSTTHFVSVIFMLLLYHTDWCYCRRLDNNQVPAVENVPASCIAVSLSDDSLHVSWCSSDDHSDAVKSGFQFEVIVNSDATCNNFKVRQEALRTTKCEETLQGYCAGGNHNIHVSLNGVLMFECNSLSRAGQSSSPYNLPPVKSQYVYNLNEGHHQAEVKLQELADGAVSYLASDANGEEIKEPGPPESMKATAVSSAAVAVSWARPNVTNGPISFYRISWIRKDNFTGSNSPNGDQTSFVFKDLLPYTDYTFLLAACNIRPAEPKPILLCGKNSTSEARTKTAAPGKPKFLTDTSITKTSIEVKWTKPDVFNGPLDGYTIDFTKTDTKEPVLGNKTNSTQFKGESLSPWTSYTIAVCAYNNPDDGTDKILKSVEESITRRTKVSVPSKPRNLATASRTSNTIMLKWDRPSVPNGPVNGYIVSATEKGSSGPTQQNTASTTSSEIRDLKPWTEYSISVKAYNVPEDGGEKLLGDEESTSSKTQVGAPGIPKPLTINLVTTTTIEVEWERPDVTNGLLDGYNILFTEKISNTQILHERTTNTKIIGKNLTPYVMYTISVRAYNKLDGEVDKITESEAAIVEKRTKVGVPGKPSSLTIANKTSTTIKITFKPPVKPNGPINGYQIKVTGKSNNVVKEDTTTETSFEILDLKPWTNYSISVKAYNDPEGGGGALVGEEVSIIGNTQVGAPGIPGPLNKIAVTSTTIEVEWKGPSVTNGPLNGYEIVFIEKGSDAIFWENKTTSTRFKAVGLTPWTNYSISVRAYNNIEDAPGEMVKSDAVFTTLQTVIGVPSEPRDLVVTAKYNTTIELSWQPPEKPNGPRNEYVVCFTEKNVEECNSPDNQETTTNTTFEKKELMPHTNYSISVKACNKLGEQKLCSEEEIITAITRIEAPGIPRNLRVTNATSTTLEVEWEKPVAFNGPLDGYTIFIYNVPNSMFLENDTSGTQFTGEGLTPWTNYTILVLAYNMPDDGSVDRLNGYPEMIYEKTKIAVPEKPANLSLNATGRAEMLVSWIKPTVNPGPTEYKLKVTRYKDSITGNGDPVQVDGCDELNDWATEYCNISGLEPYTFYSAQLTAFTEVGESDAASSSRQRTLQDVPDVSNFTMPDVPNSENVKPPTSHSAEIEIPQLKFPANNGPVTLTLLVAGERSMAPEVRQGSETLTANPLPAFNEHKPTAMYRASPENWNPFPANQYQAAEVSGLPCKFIPEKDISICELGTQGNCQQAQSTYCNAALKSNTKYLVKIRAYTDSGWAETSALKVQTKTEDSSEDGPNVLGIVLGVVFGALFLLTLVLLFIFRARIFRFIEDRRRPRETSGTEMRRT